jgi:hypothetical protein
VTCGSAKAGADITSARQKVKYLSEATSLDILILPRAERFVLTMAQPCADLGFRPVTSHEEFNWLVTQALRPIYHISLGNHPKWGKRCSGLLTYEPPLR